MESNEAALRVLKKVGINTFGTLDRRSGLRRRRLPPAAGLRAPQRHPQRLVHRAHASAGHRPVRAGAGRLTTRNWEMFDLAHAVLPTSLELERFYRRVRPSLHGRLFTAGSGRAAYGTRASTGSGRSIGSLPSPALAWRSLGTLRSMTDPREYLLGHGEESRSRARLARSAVEGGTERPEGGAMPRCDEMREGEVYYCEHCGLEIEVIEECSHEEGRGGGEVCRSR